MTVCSFGQLWSNVVSAAKFLMAFCLIWLHESGVMLSPLQRCRGKLGKVSAPVALSYSWHWDENGFLYRFFPGCFSLNTKIKKFELFQGSWDLAVRARGSGGKRGWVSKCLRGLEQRQWVQDSGPMPGGKASLICCWESSHVGVNTSWAV